MTGRPDPELLIAFLEGRLDDEERAKLLAELDSDPALAAELEEAVAGLEALETLAAEVGPDAAPERDAPSALPSRGVSPWWLAAVAVGTLALAIPLTLAVGPRTNSVAVTGEALSGQFVLVLRGRWFDSEDLDAEEYQARMDEYWAWTTHLADEGVLLATSDLGLQSGLATDPDTTGDALGYAGRVVGMFTVSTDTYREALALARSCPHLKFGGSVTVQRVSGGFVTISGLRDWTG